MVSDTLIKKIKATTKSVAQQAYPGTTYYQLSEKHSPEQLMYMMGYSQLAVQEAQHDEQQAEMNLVVERALRSAPVAKIISNAVNEGVVQALKERGINNR